MKKNSSVKQSPKRAAVGAPEPITIGMDLGDKTSRYCVLGAKGEISSEGSVATTKQAMAQKLSRMRRCRIALEVGTHSPWLSRLLTNLGFEVIVANARQVPLISASSGGLLMEAPTVREWVAGGGRIGHARMRSYRDRGLPVVCAVPRRKPRGCRIRRFQGLRNLSFGHCGNL